MLRVIGTGFGRTGTLSTKAALERLTGGRCYHMYEALAHLDHLPGWMRADEGDPDSLRTVLDGYTATVDWPGCGLWRELSALFPEARVLVTTRPVERWWNSYRETIHQLMLRPVMSIEEHGPDLALMSRFGDRLTKRSFPDDYASLTRDDFVAAYEQHNAQVRAEIADDRLLEYDVSQGWEPLCAMLEVPVPDEPFPRHNDTADFRALFGLDGDPPPRDQPFTRDELEGHFGDALPEPASDTEA